MSLHIVALFKIKENYIMEGLELLKRLRFDSKKEEGCLEYDLMEDTNQKGIFFIFETWETEDHHLKHATTEHIIQFRNEIKPLLQSSKEVYKGFKVM